MPGPVTVAEGPASGCENSGTCRGQANIAQGIGALCRGHVLIVLLRSYEGQPSKAALVLQMAGRKRKCMIDCRCATLGPKT
mmetsp:Transcript_6261/g.8054  ORF Transcript_6261/g.8054 Transcript_6261/m.8054 type:complete len:81 (-) Transcript_6261:63-305(-)